MSNREQFQLVLQFCGETLDDYDKLIVLENILIDALAGFAKVDGHDLGSSEMNIFIFTEEPGPTLNRITPHLAKQNMLAGLIAAYRERTGENYTVLWPVGHTQPFKIT